MTKTGHKQVKALCDVIRQLGLSMVVAGTGMRFIETLHDLLPGLISIKDDALYSPFAGTPSATNADGTITLVPGFDIRKEQWLGVGNDHAFGVLRFVRSLEDNTLVITDEELLTALRIEGFMPATAKLYKLDTNTMTIGEI